MKNIFNCWLFREWSEAYFPKPK